MGRRSNSMLLLLLAIATSVFADVAITQYDIDLSWLEYADSQTGFIITSSNDLYKTTDEGLTWTLQSTPSIMPGSDVAGITNIYVDLVDPNRIYFPGENNNAWLTLDKGNTYTHVVNTYDLRDIQLHPTRAGYLLSQGLCSGPACTAFYSTNMGLSWAPISQSVYTLSWGRAGEDGVSSDIVYLLNSDLTFVYTTDYGVSSTTIYSPVVGFAFDWNYLFIGLYDSTSNEVKLLISSDDVDPGHTNPSAFMESVFPFGGELPNQAYNILDDSTRAVWLGVNHGYRTWGNVYLSGSRGYDYDVGIQHVGFYYGLYDFDMFHGLEGIYVANNISNWQEDSTNPKMKTCITFDDGGEWRYLVPPSVDAYGNPIICSGTCSLNLHGISSWFKAGGYGPFYSTDNAIGLLVSTGNTGDYLSFSQSATNTYISRDAGLTWAEIKKGSSIYEFGDHGGILVMADNNNPTTSLWYSVDEGLTLVSVPFSSVPINVDNIRIEPSSTGRKFVLHGTDASGNGKLFGLDFSSVQPRTCIYPDDYEDWTPTDGRTDNQRCILGRTLIYSRRKQSANCFNERTRDTLQANVSCQCTTEDYECDFGFVSETDSYGQWTCVMDTSYVLPADPPADCPEGTTYTVTNGYRLVGSDSCVDGLDLRPTVKQCPSGLVSKIKSHKALVAGILITLVIIGLAIGGFFAWRNEELRAKIIAVLPKLPGLDGYSRVDARPRSLADEEFGANDDDDEEEEEAKEIGDTDINAAARGSTNAADDEFNPRM